MLIRELNYLNCEEHRLKSVPQLMDTLFNDLRYAVRGLLKHPTFAAISILTLALGIGANTAIFSVTDKLLLRSLAVRNPEQLFLITSVSVSPHFVSNAFS